MLTLFGDESYDDHTYVLGGWLITPTHYSLLGESWKKMLGSLRLADGSPCPSFHAQNIMSQSGIYSGWGKDEAFHAFDQATAVFTERPTRFAASPCAVATRIPTSLAAADRDEIWKLLFMRFFALVLECSPGAKSVEFVFDRKPEIEKYAGAAYDIVATAYASVVPDTFLKGMTFVDDDKAAPIQAADLLLFEWRKSLTYRQIDPSRDIRPWFPRLRASRPGGALVVYDIEKELQDARGITEAVERATRMVTGPVVGRD